MLRRIMGTAAEQRKQEESRNELTNATHCKVNHNSSCDAAITTTITTPINKTDLAELLTPTQQQQKQQQQKLVIVEKNKDYEEQQIHGNLPKPSPPPQVIIIPAQQASTVVTNAAKKVRRAFSMPRNPFRWSRKFKTSNSSENNNAGVGGSSSNSAITSCVGGGRGRTGSIVSLNSYEAISKDSNGKIIANGNIESIRNTVNSNNAEHVGVGGIGGIGSGSNTGTALGGKRVLRRSSFRKFLNRIAHQLSNSINVGANKHAANTLSQTIAATTTLTTANAATASTTDRVPPICGYQWPADQTPGVMGLKNHGNTCFMNAVLQCLSHTDILAEYFVLDQYKADLKRRNKINSRKFGTKGELTEQLANVLKALWTCKNESDHSTSFKAVVERYGSQFRSSTQHDAQEFLFWLLDKVHEDLNTATKRRYKSVKNTYGRPDEVIAAETLANHIRCNNSFVQAVFQAQFRSSLTCPRCKKQSNTFDPFHCVSVQLPQLTQQTIFVTVVYLKQQPHQVKYGLTVPAGSPIIALREQLQMDTGIASERMVLVDLGQDGFTRVFYDSQPVATLNGIDTIYCIEMPEFKHSKTLSTTSTTITTATTLIATASATNASAEANCKNTTTAPAAASSTHATDLLLLVANVRKQKITNDNPTTVVDVADADGGSSSIGANGKITKPAIERFGAPFSMQVPRDCSYTELQKKLLREMSGILKPEVFSYATPLKDMFRIRLQDPSADPDTFVEQVEHPLLTEMIDLALSVLSSESGPPHVKLLLEWSEPEQYFNELSNSIVDHESVARLRDNKPNDTAALTLEQCLEHYTKAETLSAEDAWRCPHCQQYLPVVKTLGLWSLPDILVVHFKRFRQHHGKGQNAAKLTTMVKFPLTAFDMSPHLARGANGETPATSAEVFRPSPWRKSRAGDSRSSTLSSRADNKETRYDLYAVCYHQGDTLETGHYTAACKNPYDRQWYKFDDQRVTKVLNDAIQEEIINNEAYMLFYQRRTTETTECSGSSSNSGDHWISRIAPPPITTATPQLTLNASKEELVGKVEETEAQIIEKVPEKAETKPVAIPKISEDIVEVTSPLCASQEELTQLIVTPQPISDINPLNVDELNYADEDELLPNTINNPLIVNDVQVEDKLEEKLDDTNQIFVMDEDTATLAQTPSKLTTVKEVLATPIAATTEISCIATINTNGYHHTNSSVTNTTIPNTAISPKSPISQASSSSASSSATSLSSRSSPHSLAASTFGASTLQTKFNIYALTNNSTSANSYKDTIQATNLKSNSSSIIAAASAAARSHEFQLTRNSHHHWHGSRSSVSAVENATQQSTAHAHGLNLRHSFSTSSNYKFRECNETLSSLLRNSANTCSKDTLLFIDQQNHPSLIEDDDDTFMGSRSLWISPVTPHKLITVSPKN